MRAAMGVIGAGMAVVMSACTRPPVEAHGRRGEVMAAYTVSGLEAQLPAGVSVLAVRAAAEAELRSRGYAIVSSTGTKDRARVVARGAGERRGDELVVTSRLTARATGIAVDPGFLGDEASARAVLDGVLTRLGR
jgi:hypothetical protein